MPKKALAINQTSTKQVEATSPMVIRTAFLQRNSISSSFSSHQTSAMEPISTTQQPLSKEKMVTTPRKPHNVTDEEDLSTTRLMAPSILLPYEKSTLRKIVGNSSKVLNGTKPPSLEANSSHIPNQNMAEKIRDNGECTIFLSSAPPSLFNATYLIAAKAAACQIPIWAWIINGLNTFMQFFVGAFAFYWSIKLQRDINFIKVQMCTNLDLNGSYLLAREA